MSQNSGGTNQRAKQSANQSNGSNEKQRTCWKCGLICKNRQGLSVHQNKCLSNAVKGESFYRNERIDLNSFPGTKHIATNEAKPRTKAPDEDSDFEKILPPSQPLSSPFNNRKDIRKEDILKVRDYNVSNKELPPSRPLTPAPTEATMYLKDSSGGGNP